jgi:hypothetical protein
MRDGTRMQRDEADRAKRKAAHEPPEKAGFNHRTHRIGIFALFVLAAGPKPDTAGILTGMSVAAEQQSSVVV